MKKIETVDRVVKVINSIINNFAIIILVFLMIISIYAIIDKHKVYEEAKIDDDIKALRPLDDDVTFTLDDLLKVNNEINAWIRVNDTEIDYPVVQGTDNIKYLTNNYKSIDTGSGSIFLDSRNNVNFEDDYNIIYGHNLQSNLMFGEILNYKKKKFFNSHRIGRLYTLTAQYKIEIFSFSLIDSSKDDAYVLEKYKKGHNDYIINLFKKNAVHYKDINVAPTDKLLMLSTCNDEGTFERSVLLAKLTKEVDVKTKTITTRKSKLSDDELADHTKNEYEAPLPVEEDLSVKLPKRVSILKALIIIAMLIVLYFYVKLVLNKVFNKQKELAVEGAPIQQSVELPQQQINVQQPQPVELQQEQQQEPINVEPPVIIEKHEIFDYEQTNQSQDDDDDIEVI